ncbi:isopeptide-forming domain-containing fimbrial protein [Pseudoscardovia radai]|uniref:isopeptide-forming domain-containing fimbrial protein n=1 Tax=Pseudoscardovia radai TaxID=987066 RepID=UPI003993D107
MKAISSSITKVVALIAAMIVALGTFGLAAAHADGYDTNTIADPDANGTITINRVSGDTQTRSFNGYRLASLKDVKTDSTGTALGSFTVETNGKYTQVIETVMGQITDTSTGKTLLDGYKANAWYYNTSVTPNINNPLGYIAATYGSVAETAEPWGGDNADGAKDTVMRQFADKLSAALAADTTTYPADADLKIGSNTVPQGLYLITETTNLANATDPGITGAAVNSAPMIVSTTYLLKDTAGNEATITTGVGTINLKATSPTITKQLTNGNTVYGDAKANPDFSIGDEVDYELTATIPSYTGYDIDTAGTDNTKARVLKIYDVAEPSLTIGSADSVTVTVTPDGSSTATTLVKDTDYTVETSTDSDSTDSYKGGTKTVINLANYVNMRAGTVSAKQGTVASGGTITVTVKATLNSKALESVSDASTKTPIKNKTSLGYSHQPNKVTDEHVQPGGEVNVYTYKFQITKKNREGDTLPGAQFAIKNNADGKYLTWTAATDTDGKNGTWGTLADKPTAAAQTSAAPADQSEPNAKGIFYSGADGTVSLNGLKAGTYTIEEIASPSGYLNINALLPSFTVTITPTYEQDTSTNPYANDAAKKASWGDYSATGLTISNSKDSHDLGLVTASTSNSGKVDVTNVTSVTQLPKTGAAGIAFFAIVGVALIGAAALFAVRARKARQAV